MAWTDTPGIAVIIFILLSVGCEQEKLLEARSCLAPPTIMAVTAALCDIGNCAEFADMTYWALMQRLDMSKCGE